jgi:hypothetical protein
MPLSAQPRVTVAIIMSCVIVAGAPLGVLPRSAKPLISACGVQTGGRPGKYSIRTPEDGFQRREP